MARRVGHLQTQNQHERRIVRPREQIANISAGEIVAVHKAQSERAGDVGAEEEQDEETAFVVEFVVQVDTQQDADGNQRAVGDLHEGGDEGGEAEAFDDDGAEVADAAVGDVAHAAEHEEEVEFDVEEGFFDLVALSLYVSRPNATDMDDVRPPWLTYLQMLVLDSGLITLQPLHGNPLLRKSQELGSHWTVGHHNSDHNPPSTAQCADDQELVSPTCQRSVNMPNPISKEAAKCDASAVGGVPDANLDRLFLPRIPHTSNQHEARIRARFRGASKSSQYSQRPETVARSLAHQEEAPHEDVDAEILAQREPLHQEIRGKRPS